MKKSLLTITFCLFSISMFTQIPVIKAEQSPVEVERLTKTASISYEKQTGIYNLLVYSSNYFEEKYATINLGKSVEEVATSIVNLHDAMANTDTYFKVGQYSFYVRDKNTINIIPSGNITSAVGTYVINSELIDIIVEWLIVRRNLPAGNSCSISIRATFDGSCYLYVSIPQYKVEKLLISLESSNENIYNFRNLLQNRDEGDFLSSSEINTIKSWIQNGGIRHSEDADFFIKIAGQ